MELHRSINFAIPENFYDEKYGNTDYEKMVSATDLWLGKFLQKLDMKKTLVVLTADHGDLIPTSKVGHEINFIPTLVDKSRTIKHLTPKFEVQNGKLEKSLRWLWDYYKYYKKCKEIS
ncbi:MAG: hypothetical protein O3C04_04540, partial [Crenarchaeota archaeon]|nr:hypothetical protein [Thermoproteota archaeon]